MDPVKLDFFFKKNEVVSVSIIGESLICTENGLHDFSTQRQL